MAKKALAWVVLVAALLHLPLAAAAPAPVLFDRPAPERATGYAEKQGALGKKFMLAAAHPLAVQAGYQILKAGGSAVDAAVATQMVLALVEPQSSGLGGGAFLLHFDGRKVQAYDGRETAPAAVDENLFQNAEDKALGFREAEIGGRAVGVPGVLRMLELAHRQHGKLPWARLFAPAIKLASAGFPVSARLNKLLAADPYLKNDANAAQYFYDANGAPWPVGHLLKNPQLARVLRAIARAGAGAFYRGPIARAIVAKVQQHPTNPGRLSVADLAAYRAKERAPVCTDYRRWTVCGVPPPSSGGIAVAQMLGILETRDLSRLAPQAGMPDPAAIHLFAEAGRLAYADRARYVADTDFVPLPGNSVLPLIDKQYLAARAALIGERSMGNAAAGQPLTQLRSQGLDTAAEFPCTTHISIVDAQGHALAMTTTIEDGFGSRQMVRGFLLNNQLTDFSFDARDENGPVANRVEAGKRPRSAMAPTLVFDQGSRHLVLAIGSPGGSAIINYVAKVLVATLDWNMGLQQAINLPNFGSRNRATELEAGRFSPPVIAYLKAHGHTISESEQVSGLQGVMRVRREGVPLWFGAADPRREGTARGD